MASPVAATSRKTRGWLDHRGIAGLGQCSGSSRAVTSTTRGALVSGCDIVKRVRAGCGRCEPRHVLRVAAVDHVEEHLLQFLGNRSALARTDGTVVELADRRDLRCGTGEERLVGDVELVARDAALDYRNPEFRRKRDDRASRDAIERAAGEIWRVQLAVAYQEYVLAGALADEALRVEQHRFLVAVVRRLLIGKDRHRVVAHGLGVAHGDVRMMVGERRRLDANSLLETLGAEIGPPGPRGDRDTHGVRFRGNAEGLRAVKHQWTQVARIEAVFSHALLLRCVDLVLAVRDLHAEDLRRAKQAVGMVPQPEDRGACGGVVAADTFE